MTRVIHYCSNIHLLGPVFWLRTLKLVPVCQILQVAIFYPPWIEFHEGHIWMTLCQTHYLSSSNPGVHHLIMAYFMVTLLDPWEKVSIHFQDLEAMPQYCHSFTEPLYVFNGRKNTHRELWFPLSVLFQRHSQPGCTEASHQPPGPALPEGNQWWWCCDKGQPQSVLHQ